MARTKLYRRVARCQVESLWWLLTSLCDLHTIWKKKKYVMYYCSWWFSYGLKRESPTPTHTQHSSFCRDQQRVWWCGTAVVYHWLLASPQRQEICTSIAPSFRETLNADGSPHSWRITRFMQSQIYNLDLINTFYHTANQLDELFLQNWNLNIQLGWS